MNYSQSQYNCWQ